MIALASLNAGCASSGQRTLSSSEKAALYLDAANAALAEGDTAGALEHAMRAEREDKSFADVHHTKALIFANRDDSATAIAEARKAIELKPDYSAAKNTLGKLLMDSGNMTEAEKPLLEAARDPLYREAFKPWTNLGILYYRRADAEKASEYLTRAIQAAPEASCIAYYYRGHIKLQSSRFSEAIRDYDQATRKYCVNFGDAHLALGIAYERSGMYDQARRKFLEINDRYPSTALAEQALSRLKKLP